MKSLQANVLPLALVIMTAILLAGLGLGIVVLNGLRRTADIDASMSAYYAADAGVERQIYELRKRNAQVSDLSDLGDTFDANGAIWQANTAAFQQTDQKTFAAVQEGDFQIVDLIDPDNIGAAAGIDSVRWSWTGAPGCEVELGIGEIDIAGRTFLPTAYQSIRGLSSPWTQALNPLQAYRLRFQPRRCSVTNLQVTVYSGGVAQPFPGDISVGAQGTFKNTTQNISAVIPRQDVLSGVFQYVIFSECTLIKDPGAGAPACP